MTTYSSSKVVTREGTVTGAGVVATQTAVTGLVGVTQRGPYEATLCTSFAEWRQTYGDATADSLAAHQAAQGFFAEGGQFLWTARVVHWDVDGNPATAAQASVDLATEDLAPTAAAETGTEAGPWVGTPGMTLTVAVDGNPSTNAVFNATRAVSTATANGAGLANNDELTVTISQGATEQVSTVVFDEDDFANIATPTIAELVAVFNAAIAGGSAINSGGFVAIRDDILGTDSRVRITGDPAVLALFAFDDVDVAGTGNVANIAKITEAEFTTIVDAASTGVPTTDDDGFPTITSPTTGPTSSIQLGGAAAAVFGFDTDLHEGTNGTPTDTLRVLGATDGTYANALTVEVAAASSGVASEFNLVVKRAGVRVETWTNLVMDATATNYALTVVNGSAGSKLIALEDLFADLGTPLADRPVNGSFALTGGNDGLTSLADADFLGSASFEVKKGLRALDLVSNLRLLVVPGRTTSVVHNGGLTYCELTRGGTVLFLMDPPEGLTAAEMVVYVKDTAGLYESSSFGAIYWPRIRVLNPDPVTFGTVENLVVGASGHIAGLCARNDAASNGGVYKPPAGKSFGRLRTIVGLETREVEDETKRDLIYPANINPISSSSGLLAVDGVRTLQRQSAFPTVGERRGAIFIKTAVDDFLENFRLRNNDADLRAEAERGIERFLLTQFENGAFRGATPDESFFVSLAGNTPEVVFSGALVVEVGIATQKPAEFITFTLSQDLRALETAAAQALSG